MGRFELIILAIAIISFSVFSVIAVENQVNARLNIIQNEIELSALSQAEAIVERARTLDFDPYAMSNQNASMADSNNFAGPGELYSSHKDFSNFTTLNDFGSQNNEFKTVENEVVTIDGDEFYSYEAKTKVDYTNSKGEIVNHRTTHKKLTVLIEISSMDFNTQQTFVEDLEGNNTNEINVQWNVNKSHIFNFLPGDDN